MEWACLVQTRLFGAYFATKRVGCYQPAVGRLQQDEPCNHVVCARSRTGYLATSVVFVK